jgi:hypothetical protein
MGLPGSPVVLCEIGGVIRARISHYTLERWLFDRAATQNRGQPLFSISDLEGGSRASQCSNAPEITVNTILIR